MTSETGRDFYITPDNGVFGLVGWNTEIARADQLPNIPLPIDYIAAEKSIEDMLGGGGVVLAINDNGRVVNVGCWKTKKDSFGSGRQNVLMVTYDLSPQKRMGYRQPTLTELYLLADVMKHSRPDDLWTEIVKEEVISRLRTQAVAEPERMDDLMRLVKAIL